MRIRNVLVIATLVMAAAAPLPAQENAQATLAQFEQRVRSQYSYGLFSVNVTGAVASVPLAGNDPRFRPGQEMVAACFEEVKVTLLARELQRQDQNLTEAGARQAAMAVPANRRNAMKISYVADDINAAADRFGECSTAKLETLPVVDGRRIVISLTDRRNPRMALLYGAAAERAKQRVPGQTQ